MQICAVKVESRTNSKQVLRMEALVLTKLQHLQQICKFLGCGKTENVNYIIMSLLGPNLSQLRKKQSNQTFSISTVLRLGHQILNVVYLIHNSGFLHRDLKPSNFAMGVGKDCRTCYVIDFGLSRQYITPTGQLKEPRITVGFRGTIRYASVNAHLGCELGRHDDLWSVFYMLVELSTGELPWKHLHNKEDVSKIKQTFDHSQLVKNLPQEFHVFLKHLRELNYFVKPDYEYLISIVDQAMERLGINQSDPFDWEQESTPSCISTTISTGYSQPLIDEIQDNVRNSSITNNISAHEIPQYIIPLPTTPKPAGYHCSIARMSRYVKCTNPDLLISKLNNK